MIKILFNDINNLEYLIRDNFKTLTECKSMLEIQNINTEIKSNLEQLGQLLKDANEKLFERNNNTIEIEQFRKELKFHKEEYENLKVLQRKANLETSKNLQENYKQNKKMLLSGSEKITQQSRFYSSQNSKSDILKTSMSLTNKLQRTRNFMNSQVSRSEDILKELDESSKVIDKTVQQQIEYGSKTTEAKSLLTKLKRRDMTDKFLIYFGLFVFLLSVLYVFKVRFFKSTPSSSNNQNIS
ncbi:hypothetical protein DICPUDRAFT_159023 [Dictyostelium purpureum]|uniref:Sec20 C-terminal domain-containing protein n=1 Tax=Dictyostelium purpureum TaxID=5786 RepID=F1A328_DICPU|nr:uncharacterized protein DICPUDRAFT_159023 [Dictyostelium purpureum]EGC29402.1 hypothetical protein DICPUDRAFT_159023 [Dictyostelium purpureum]|eukprot:XP_003294073.1 hypothetical protein DICPUDRAFT_159023 [Dictyostelium purpureum]